MNLRNSLLNFLRALSMMKIQTLLSAGQKKIEQKGALERYFRPEHKYGDNIGAIPIEYGRVRLYCLRISDKILIVGNGDIKTTAKWQEDKKLIPHVELLIDTGKFIKSRISNGTIILSDKEIIGNLKFSR